MGQQMNMTNIELLYNQFFIKMERRGGKLQLLSRGSNSEIYAYGSNGSSVVLKVVSCACTKQARHLANESAVLKLLEHQNIIKMLKYQENISLQGTSQNKQFPNCRNVLVMENAKHGSLLNFIRIVKPSLPQLRSLFVQVSQALRYLHYLKLENILVTQAQSKIQIKLADFGFANSTHHHTQTLSNALKGTKKAYMAPQIHRLYLQPLQQYNTLKADIFALGVILFTLVMARLPFQYARPNDPHYKFISENNQEEFWKLHLNRLNAIEQESGSMVEDFKELFMEMVAYDASRRPSIEQVMERSWMKGAREEMEVGKQAKKDYQ